VQIEDGETLLGTRATQPAAIHLEAALDVLRLERSEAGVFGSVGSEEADREASLRPLRVIGLELAVEILGLLRRARRALEPEGF